MASFNPGVREALTKILVGQLKDFMFGDGQERDYILDGFEFKGLNNMTDAELAKEYGHTIEEINQLHASGSIGTPESGQVE